MSIKFENPFILFTEHYALRNKIKTSRINENVIKKAITKGLFIGKMYFLEFAINIY